MLQSSPHLQPKKHTSLIVSKAGEAGGAVYICAQHPACRKSASVYAYGHALVFYLHECVCVYVCVEAPALFIHFLSLLVCKGPTFGTRRHGEATPEGC